MVVMNSRFKHHIFLSYSRRDAEIMHRVYETLRDERLTVWTDEGIEPGTPLWDRAIEDALKAAGCMVVILTPNVMDSKGVRDEIHYAGLHKVHIFTLLAKGDPSESIPYTLSGNQWVDIRVGHASNMARLIKAVKRRVGTEVELPAPIPVAYVVQPPVAPKSRVDPLPAQPQPTVTPKAPTIDMTSDFSTSEKSQGAARLNWQKYLAAKLLLIFLGGAMGYTSGLYFNRWYYRPDDTEQYRLLASVLFAIAALVFPFLRRWLKKTQLPSFWPYGFVAIPAFAVLIILGPASIVPALLFTTILTAMSLFGGELIFHVASRLK
jgi:TIR domain